MKKIEQESFERLCAIFLRNLIDLTKSYHPDISKEHEILWKLNFHARDIYKYAPIEILSEIIEAIKDEGEK